MSTWTLAIVLSALGFPGEILSPEISEALPEKVQMLVETLPENDRKIAVAVYPDAKTQGKLEFEEVRQALRQKLTKLVEQAGATVVTSEDIEQQSEATARTSAGLRPTDLKKIQAERDVSGVMVLLFAIQDDKTGVQLSVVTNQKVSERVRLGNQRIAFASKTTTKKPGFYLTNVTSFSSGGGGGGFGGSGFSVRYRLPNGQSSSTGFFGNGAGSVVGSGLGATVAVNANAGSAEKSATASVTSQSQSASASADGTSADGTSATGTGSDSATGSDSTTGAGGKKKDCPPDSKTGKPADPGTTDPGTSDPGTTDPSTPTGDGTNSADLPELNQKVLQFAIDHLGQQVGNGECWTLADEALKAAGAEPAHLYDFGQQLESVDEVLPGDILQFDSAKFETAMSQIWLGAPNHTAIVYRVRGDQITLLHQNFNNDRTVQTLTLNFKTQTGGSTRAYRPEQRSTNVAQP